MGEPARDGALRRLPRRLQDRAVHVEQPSVVAAADPALGDDPVLERGPAVAAMPVQQAEPPGEVPEQHEVLAEHGDGGGMLPQLLAHRHRDPEPPEVLAARGAGAGVGQLRVLARVRHPVVPAVGSCARSGSRGHVDVPPAAGPRKGRAAVLEGPRAGPTCPSVNERHPISRVAHDSSRAVSRCPGARGLPAFSPLPPGEGPGVRGKGRGMASPVGPYAFFPHPKPLSRGERGFTFLWKMGSE